MGRALGRYELLRPLARGGMGEVYLARRRAAGVEKWLVVKRMRPETSGDARFLDLFMREARLSMSLAHQNIVPVFDFGRIDDQVFLAMERVEGKDLGSSLQRSGKSLPPLLAAFVAAECLQALDYAHRRKGPDGAALGIVHRDVTPRNVLLSWAGEVKLTDFGIAALASDSPAASAAGTPAYMAPEQARGEAIDVRADVYAVGLVLREALTGARARAGSGREGVLELARQGVLEPWPAAFDSPLRAIANRATSASADARYPDARAMLEELDSFIVGVRAANKGEAPARQLAAWLADTWQDARDDDDALDARIDADVLVSFLDDGALDVIGTGTQRSLLATAVEDSRSSASTDARTSLTDATTSPADATTSPVDATVAPAASVASRAEPPPASADADGRGLARRRTAVALGVAAAGLAAVSLWALSGARGGGAAPAADASLATVTLAGDAGVEERPPPDRDRSLGAMTSAAAGDAGAATSPPALGDAAAPAAVGDAGTTRADAAPSSEPVAPRQRSGSRPRPGQPGVTPDAGLPAPAIVEAPAVVLRKVTINSRPWSNWSVDGGRTYSGLQTIELAPGAHTIHFTGNPYFKADTRVTIEVPDRDGYTHVEALQPAAAP